MDGIKILVIGSSDNTPSSAFSLPADSLVVDHVSSATKAILQLKKYPLYDVILLETEIGQLTSLQAAREIKEIGFVGLIFAYTSLGLHDLREAICKGYIDGLVSKPYNLRNLAGLVKKHGVLSPYLHAAKFNDIP